MSPELDEIYGVLRSPERLDRWEKNKKPVSLSYMNKPLAKNLEQIRKLASDSLFKAAEKSKTYLWVVNEKGNLVIAVEEIAPKASYAGYPRRRGYHHPSEQKKLGHPTLVEAKAARMAGELGLDDDLDNGDLIWVINANSGRYCKQNPPQEKQVDNVAKLFRKFGMEVVVDRD